MIRNVPFSWPSDWEDFRSPRSQSAVSLSLEMDACKTFVGQASVFPPEFSNANMTTYTNQVEKISLRSCGVIRILRDVIFS